ncbi:MAG: S8 family serine peptidase [Bacteroidota bacterium]|nr:S8 family serine peptidase [Bacteroidota bacterium]
MKKILLVLLSFFIIDNSYSQKVQVTERLSVKMKSLNPIQYTRVLILLKDRVDIDALDQYLYKINAPLQYRAETVINTLKIKAEQTQEPILKYLYSERESGKIRQVVKYWITNMIFIEATPDVLEMLTKRVDVDVLDLDAELEMDKPFDETPAPNISESIETGLKVIKADSLWRLGITGAGRTVMNIDGGVNGTHPALSPRWWGNNGRQWYHSWYDPIAPVSTSPFDCATGGTYHGTHTMGIMCGRNSATGDTVGVAPDARWMAAGVTDCPSASYPSMNIAAFQWAMDPDSNAATMNMPDVISCSWRDPTVTDECTTSIYRSTLTALEAAGIAVVFSAGNSGPGASTITPPKNISIDSVNVFCVGNVNGNTAGYPISSSSSRGPSICGGTGTLLIKPEVCAPGTSIRSTGSGSSYFSISGTSMASPHVAGCIALLKQAAPNMTGRQLKAILFSTATDLGAASEDNSYGKGLVNVYKAYQMLGPVIQHTQLPNTENLAGPYTINCSIFTSESGIDPSKTKLFWSRDNASVEDSLLMTNSGGTNWTADIPGNGSPAAYRYYIKTTDSTGRTSVSPAGAPSSLYMFTAQQDNSNPVITHLPLPDQAKPYWPVLVSATVTDDIGIDSSWVIWYKNSVVNTKEFKLINVSGNNYSALFNSLNSDVNIGDFIYYKIFAKDNSVSHNMDSTSLYSFKIIDVKLCEGFFAAAFPPANWNIEFTGTNYWTRNNVSSYGIGSGSAKFDFWTAPNTTVQSLVTLTFANTLAGDSLKFEHAYAPYTNGTTDSLEIQVSSNSGSSYSTLVRLWGNNVNGNLNTRAQLGSVYTAPNTEWAAKKYSLPAGTNKIKFRARSGFGNNLYLDSICIINSTAPVPATITLAQEGFYNTSTLKLNIRDSVSIYLRNSTVPFAIADSGKIIVDSVTLSGSLTFNTASTGTYYVVVRHRNSIETWSKSGGESYVKGAAFSYDFTSGITQAFGNNLIIRSTKYCIYSGDVNQDYSIDLSDLAQIDNALSNFTTGYVSEDLNGDFFVDLADYTFADNSAADFVTRIAPPGAEPSANMINTRRQNNNEILKTQIKADVKNQADIKTEKNFRK